MAIKKLQGLDAIRRWVVKTFLKEKEQTGVMVNLPKKDFVDLNTSITAERLMRNGIDPNSIKSEDQVENIINQLNKPKVVSQGDPEFKGIMSKMLGSNVIKADFGKPFKEEIKKMKSDEEIVSNIKKSNERSVQNLRMQMMDDKVANDMFQGGPSRDPKTDADMLAEFIAEDAGKIYDDLPTKERLKFYDRAYNAIIRYKRRDPEDMADGGRIGYKLGTFKKIGEGVKSFAEFLNKKNPVQAYTDYLKSIKDKTLKANKTGKFTDLPLAEVGIPAAGGMLINRAVKKKLEAMSKEDVERKKERDDKANGGRIGFKDGLEALSLGDRGFFIKPKKRTIVIDGVEYEIPIDKGFEIKPDPNSKAVPPVKMPTYPKEKRADGGRIGFKKGMDRRTFMKMVGGLTALPILGKLFKGAEIAAPVAEKTVEAAKTVPPYFLKLAEQIKLLGRQSSGPQERINVYSMKGKDGKSELMLTEDVGTGEMQIKKIGKENDEMVSEVQTMEYTPGKAQADEATKGTPADQYEEYTEYNSRIYKDEFNEPDIVDGIDAEDISKEIKDKFDVEQEILEEVARDKKASGGIAMMLGE